jgi:hypothetical protein
MIIVVVVPGWETIGGVINPQLPKPIARHTIKDTRARTFILKYYNVPRASTSFGFITHGFHFLERFTANIRGREFQN